MSTNRKVLTPTNPDQHDRTAQAAVEPRREHHDFSRGHLLISDRNAAKLLDISRASLWRFVGSKLLPAPVKLGGRTLWRYDELAAAVDRLAAERDGGV